MKNRFTIGVAILFVSLTGFAQQRKGKWLVGGSIDSYSQTNKVTFPSTENTNGRFSVNPKVGYFFADRWAVGLAPGYSFQSQEDSAQTTKGKSYNVGAFVRYYQPVGEKLAIFGELNGISYGAGNNTQTYKGNPVTQENTYRSLSVGAFIRPGIVYFITPKIGLETSFGGVSLGYYSNKSKSELRNVFTTKNETTSNGFTAGLNFNYQFNLGVLFYLGQ